MGSIVGAVDHGSPVLTIRPQSSKIARAAGKCWLDPVGIIWLETARLGAVDNSARRGPALLAMWTVNLGFDVNADLATLARWEESLVSVNGTITPITDDGGVRAAYSHIEVAAHLDASGPMEAANEVVNVASRVVGAVPSSVHVMTEEERARSFPDW